MTEIINAITNFLQTTGVYKLFAENDNWWQYLVMYVIIGALFYLAIVKKFEPLLLMPIAFGMLLANLPAANLIHLDYFFDDYYLNVVDGPLASQLESFTSLLDVYQNQWNVQLYEIVDNVVSFDFSPLTKAQLEEIQALLNNTTTWLEVNNYTSSMFGTEMPDMININFPTLSNALYISDGTIHVKMTYMIKEVINNGGLLDILYLGVKLGVYPSLIFMGVGAMTDFTPLIANPKSLLMGAGAQLGVFAAFFFALFMGFTPMQAGSIGIIGGADGPTAILVTKILAPELLGAIAIAAYSYMALIPIIQPPFMRLLTTEKERTIKMGNLRTVTKLEKVIFPIIVTAIVCLIIPDAAPLVGFLMLGNLFNVSGVADRLSKTAQNELINIVTIFLGVSVGATASAENFLKPQTIFIIILGLCAFCLSTVGGLITGKIMCKLTGGKINPLIGSAGVSAVPMAARVAQDEGRKYDPSNFLLMHAMGPNVAGVIGSAVAAGVFLSFLG